MLDFKRRYRDDTEFSKLAYHYCDGHAFHAICTSQTLRFGSVEAMNDALELKWGQEVFLRAAQQWKGAHPEEGGAEFIEAVEVNIINHLQSGHFLAACLSLDGDLLSQWRAYTNDATGFAIGFDLKPLALNLDLVALEVMYDRQTQENEVLNWLDNIYSELNQSCGGDQWFPTDLQVKMLATDLVAYKNPAFSEEREVRLVLALDYVQIPPRGTKQLSSRLLRHTDKVSFLMKHGVPTPYVDDEFAATGQFAAINEVIIGPKNPSTTEQIEIYLHTLGIDCANVRKSEASYR